MFFQRCDQIALCVRLPYAFFDGEELLLVMLYCQLGTRYEYVSPKEARQGLSTYVQFYNQQRLHQALDYQTPAAVYFRAKSDSVAGVL